MYEAIIAWAGIGLLLLLSLPVPGIQRTLLAVYGLALRIAMLGMIVAAGYLWFRPEQLPGQVADSVNNIAILKSILPAPGTPIFGVCAASLVALIVLPLIAVIDVSRRYRIVREKAVVSERVAVPVEPAYPAPPAVPSRFSRRAAANALANVGSR